MAARVVPDRDQQVQACLDTVMDPELDESVTSLGFVTGVEHSEGGVVRVGFRLPTYWCAANFAFLMADDMRIAIGALPWVTRVHVELHEHMYAEAINRGVSDGQGFQACFGEAAAGGLDGLRRTFLLKAFQRRQSALLEYLLAESVPAEALAAMRLDELRRMALDAEGELLVARYLERRGVVDDGEQAFVDVQGQPISAQALPGLLRELRRVSVNAEFNGVLCRGLLAVRYGEAQAGAPAEPVAQPIAIVRRGARLDGQSAAPRPQAQ